MLRALALVLAGCGARTELVAPPLGLGDAGADALGGDSGAIDAGPSPCDATTPVMLAGGGKEIQFIALDHDHVYWTDFVAGTVSVVAKTGGAVTTLGEGRGSPSGIITRGGMVYWAEFTGNDVVASPVGGGTVTTIAGNQDGAYEVTSAGDGVYWTTTRGCAVAHLETDGGVHTLASANQPFTAIHGAGSLVFWVSFEQKAVERFDVASAMFAPVLTSNTGASLPASLATDGVNLYLGGSSTEAVEVTSLPAGGGVEQIVYEAACNADAGVTSSGCLGDLTTDGTHVYFTTSTNDGLVQRVPLDGGASTTFATGQHRPFSIAVDDRCVYWSNLADGTVWAAGLDSGR